MDIEQLFLEFYRPLCLYALRFVGDIDKAEDVVQDCFVKILERPGDSLQQYDDRGRRALLFCIVHNHCIDELRRAQAMANIPLETTEEEMENAFSAARLWTAIDALPDRCREVFLMAKRDGMTYREIAEELGISERTVEHQVSKALHLLRQQKSVFFRLLLFL